MNNQPCRREYLEECPYYCGDDSCGSIPCLRNIELMIYNILAIMRKEFELDQ